MFSSATKNQKNMTPKEKVTSRIKRDHRLLIARQMLEESTAKAKATGKDKDGKGKKGRRNPHHSKSHEDAEWQALLASAKKDIKSKKRSALTRGRSLFRSR